MTAVGRLGAVGDGAMAPAWSPATGLSLGNVRDEMVTVVLRTHTHQRTSQSWHSAAEPACGPADGGEAVTLWNAAAPCLGLGSVACLRNCHEVTVKRMTADMDKRRNPVTARWPKVLVSPR